MGLEAKVGIIGSPSSTGYQATTGVGFQPKLLLLWGVNRTSDGTQNSSVLGFGAAVSSSARAALSCATRNSVTDTDKFRRHSNTKCVSTMNILGATFEEADLVSFDSDGFTLNWTTVGSGAYWFGYLALGGDLLSAHLKEITSPTSTGTVGYTGIGFQPDALLSMTVGHSTAAPDTDSGANTIAIGFGTGPAQRAAAGFGSDTFDSANRTQVQTAFLRALDGGGSDELVADIDSLDADGYTLDWTTVDAAARYCWVLALKGGQYAVGNDEQKTSTGTRATTGIGFQPIALFAQSFNNVKNTSILANYRHSLGAASGPGERWSTWHGEKDGASTAVADRSNESDEFLQMITEGTPTINAEADLDSFDTDGFTLNWTTADAVVREFIFLAIGDADVSTDQAFQIAPAGLDPTGDQLIWELTP